MTNRERQLELGSAVIGLSLSRVVARADGQVLMAQGVVLNDGAVRQLLRHDIQSVWVFDPALEPVADAPVLTHASARDRLEHLFRHLGESPSNRFLLDVVKRYRQGEEP